MADCQNYTCFLDEIYLSVRNLESVFDSEPVLHSIAVAKAKMALDFDDEQPFNEIFAFPKEIDNDVYLSMGIAEIAVFLSRTRRIDRAREALHEAIRIGQEVEDRVERESLLALLVGCCTLVADIADDSKLLHEAVELVRQIDNKDTKYLSLVNIAYQWGGYDKENIDIRRLEDSFKILQEIEDEGRRILPLISLAEVWMRLSQNPEKMQNPYTIKGCFDWGRGMNRNIGIKRKMSKLPKIFGVGKILKAALECAESSKGENSIYQYSRLAEAFVNIDDDVNARKALEYGIGNITHAKADHNLISDLCKMLKVCIKLGDYEKAKFMLKEIIRGIQQIKTETERDEANIELQSGLIDVINETILYCGI